MITGQHRPTLARCSIGHWPQILRYVRIGGKLGESRNIVITPLSKHSRDVPSVSVTLFFVAVCPRYVRKEDLL
jgi:hypothetical protein